MKTIDPHVKSRVIELFQAKKEYREIVQILKAEGIKISFGSCWNIVSKWKGLNRIDGLENQGRESTALRLTNPNYVGYSGYFEVGNIYRLPFENSTEPVLMLASGHIPVSNPEINQQPEITQSETSQPVNTQLQTSTDDLSTFTPVYKENVDLHNEVQPSHPYQSVNTQTSTDNSTMFTPVYSENVDMPDVDFDNQPYDQLLEGDYNPALDGESGERLLGFVETSQNIKPDLVNNKHVFEKVTEIEGLTTTTDQPPTRPPDSTDSKLDLGVDWDQSFHTRFVKWVMHQKRVRDTEKKMLELHWRSLKRGRSKLEAEKRDFEAAEADLAQRIVQVKDLIPIAAEFKQIGLDFSLANSWLSCVKEMAIRKGLDLRSAAWKLAEDLKSWQQLGGFETAVSNAKHQLSLLQIASENQKSAIAALVDLRKSGIYEHEILQVVETIRSKNNSHDRNFELDVMDSPEPPLRV